MAPLAPYTYIQCPCSDASSSLAGTAADASSPTGPENEEEEDGRTFDPRAPRSNYSLYPLEYLLYCEDCHQIRCPRCISEEIVTYYCPNCLFEVPSGNIKSEGNRCTRSCFQCPVCVGPLSVQATESAPDPNLLSAPDNSGAPQGGSAYVLTCSYCNWSSSEIGLTFEKPNGLYAQLAKVRNGGATRVTARERKDRRKAGKIDEETAAGADSGPEAGTVAGGREEELDVEGQFANLKAFYQDQLEKGTASASGISGLGDLGFASPGSLSRIMSMYTGSALYDKKSKGRAVAMREALTSDEGLQPAGLDESGAVDRLHELGWDGTTSAEQFAVQPPNVGEAQLHGRARFAPELRPVAYLLRTKRAKRCPVCRHIISKPEAKVQTTRFRIRLVAASYIPSISIRPLNAPDPAGAGLLAPLKPVQYLLTFKNPIFESVKVTLATPATTPGRFASRVTILCPQFEIDANMDAWEDALGKDGAGGPGTAGGTGSSRAGGSASAGDRDRRRRGEDGQYQAEAGKIWERGRNWVSIVVEIVPSSLRLDTLALMNKRDGDEVVDTGPIREDEDILEIPMFVRLEWETDAAQDEVGHAPGKDKDAREKRELAYWSVLGIGRISQA